MPTQAHLAYIEQTIVTVSKRECIIWCDQQFEQGQHAWITGQDILWLHVSIVGFWTFLLTQFQSQILSQAMALVPSTFQWYCTLGSSSQIDIIKVTTLTNWPGSLDWNADAQPHTHYQSCTVTSVIFSKKKTK